MTPRSTTIFLWSSLFSLPWLLRSSEDYQVSLLCSFLHECPLIALTSQCYIFSY
ncbi:hypothetical protein GLYMA_05G090733v4 [Glycine max]|nr:hypothetical protein GLYMA_05G090733v4 [Glycine max]KAH1133426.1 hypothetical protein GYH30_012012 [Glycine max]